MLVYHDSLRFDSNNKDNNTKHVIDNSQSSNDYVSASVTSIGDTHDASIVVGLIVICSTIKAMVMVVLLFTY